MSVSKQDLEFLFRSIPVPNDKTKQDFIDFLFTSSPGGGKGVFVDGTFFSTLTEAKPAMTAGKIAYVNPGVYNENDLLNGIDPTANWYFLPGAIIDYDGTVGDPSKAIFDSSSLISYQGNILGYGEFRKATDASLTGIIFLDNAADSVYFEALNTDAKGNTAFLVNAGDIIIRVEQTIETDAGVGVKTTGTGQITVYSDTIEDISGTVFAIDSFAGKIVAFCNKISPGIRAVLTGELDVTFDLISSPALFSSTIEIASDAKLTAKGRRIEHVGIGSVNLINHLSTEDSLIDVLEIENIATDFSGRIISSGGSGKLTVKNASLKGNVNANRLISIEAGSTGITLFENVRAENLSVDGSANTSVIQVLGAGATLILDDITLITNGGGDSITANAARNIKVYGGVANKAVDVNITEQVNNLTIDPLVE